MSTEEYYFAIGSFMADEFMRQNGVEFLSREPASLADYEFKFCVEGHGDGTAFPTVVPNEGSTVHGVLYRLQDSGFKRLDELILVGGKSHYAKEEVTVALSNSSSLEKKSATTYVARPEVQKEGLKPNQKYLKMVLDGADLVPDHYLQFLKSFQN